MNLLPGIAELRFGFEQLSAPDRDQFGHGNKLLVRRHRFEESHAQFDAVGKSFRPHADRPDHRFIHHGRNQAAVHRLFEAHMLRPRRESGADNPAVRFQVKLEPDGIVKPADETRFGMRQL